MHNYKNNVISLSWCNFDVSIKFETEIKLAYEVTVRTVSDDIKEPIAMWFIITSLVTSG